MRGASAGAPQLNFNQIPRAVVRHMHLYLLSSLSRASSSTPPVDLPPPLLQPCRAAYGEEDPVEAPMPPVERRSPWTCCIACGSAVVRDPIISDLLRHPSGAVFLGPLVIKKVRALTPSPPSPSSAAVFLAPSFVLVLLQNKRNSSARTWNPRCSLVIIGEVF
jgi:hypothetical protein